MGRPKGNCGGGVLYERKCSKCGKVFVPAPLNIYKKNGKVYCSWTCYNHRNDKDFKKGGVD